jgi:hypothetical protein
MKKEEIYKTIEPLHLTIPVTALNLNLRFPLTVWDERDYLDSQIFSENESTDKVTPFYLFLLKSIMNDCLTAYKDDRTSPEGQFIDKFIREKYDPLDLDKSVNYFKNICRCSSEEIEQICEFKALYARDLSNEKAEVDKKHNELIKQLDLEPNLSATDKKLKLIEAENAHEAELKSLKEKLQKKYNVH